MRLKQHHFHGLPSTILTLRILLDGGLSSHACRQVLLQRSLTGPGLQGKVQQPLAGWWGHARPFDFATQYEPAADINQFQCGTPSILAMTALEVGLPTRLTVRGRMVPCWVCGCQPSGSRCSILESMGCLAAGVAPS